MSADLTPLTRAEQDHARRVELIRCWLCGEHGGAVLHWIPEHLEAFAEDMANEVDGVLAPLDAERAKVADLAAALEKFTAWLERQATRERRQAETCNFESLREAWLADAKNHEAMAKDGRAALGKAGGP